MSVGTKEMLRELEKACQETNGALRFRSERAQKFEEYFDRYYGQIKAEFMSADTKALDIHKQAATIVFSAIRAQVIEQTDPCAENEVSIGAYVVALNVALSILQGHMNRKLKRSGSFGEKEASLVLPLAFACDTPYFEIMCRLLYYKDPCLHDGKSDYDIECDILEWADRFFLLEYITLLSSGINPSVYKDIPNPDE